MKGFTLLEILITIILFTTGVAALVWAISSGIYASVGIEEMDLALNIAQARMEDIKNKSFTAIEAGGDSGPTADSDFSNFNVTVDVAGGEDPMQVDVTVSWKVRGGQDRVTLTTLVADI